MKFKAFDGHVRSSVSITLVSVLALLLTILQALPESKWTLLAIAIIGAILVFLNSPDNKKGGEKDVNDKSQN